jgi:hypothetical protein
MVNNAVSEDEAIIVNCRFTFYALVQGINKNLGEIEKVARPAEQQDVPEVEIQAH